VTTLSVHVDFGVVGSCDGFDVSAAFDPTRRITTYYDSDGMPIREQIHAEIPGIYTNLGSGATLATTGLRNITRDLVTGEFTSTGSNVHVVVPGQGSVLLASGFFSVDESGNVREVGRQDPPLTDALCAALALA
jgi:hypothetical protein